MKKFLLLSVCLISALFLASCTQKEQDIINPDAEFQYFFGVSCPHCQELNRIAESRDLWSMISIEKREVYYNRENSEIFLALIKELWMEDAGVPFAYDKVTGKYASWVRPVLELLTSRLGQETSENENTEIPEPSKSENENDENTETTQTPTSN